MVATMSTQPPFTMDALVSLCKRRGFIFPASEVYGGLNGFWDYGPLGTELKNNIRDAWWHDAVPAASADCPVEWMDAEAPLSAPFSSRRLTTSVRPCRAAKCSGVRPSLSGTFTVSLAPFLSSMSTTAGLPLIEA